jgi:hypothetical protein
MDRRGRTYVINFLFLRAKSSKAIRLELTAVLTEEAVNIEKFKLWCQGFKDEDFSVADREKQGQLVSDLFNTACECQFVLNSPSVVWDMSWFCHMRCLCREILYFRRLLVLTNTCFEPFYGVISHNWASHRNVTSHTMRRQRAGERFLARSVANVDVNRAIRGRCGVDSQSQQLVCVGPFSRILCAYHAHSRIQFHHWMRGMPDLLFAFFRRPTLFPNIVPRASRSMVLPAKHWAMLVHLGSARGPSPESGDLPGSLSTVQSGHHRRV